MGDERVERRLAAILAADVVGYSRLVGMDEEGTLAALKALRKSLIDPKVTEHRGRIVKNTGDGALVEFASAVDAVRCALETQRAMADRTTNIPEDRRIEFRIGINIGDIVIEEGDIFGDGVNIAVRLESIAAPGGVCISEDVYRQMRGKFDATFEDIGEQKLKNIVQPVRVYRVRIGGTAGASTGEHPTNLPLPDKPSIAVLAFQNMSGDLEQEYFADGIAEDIITALSKSRWLFVIARNSSFTYKGRAVDIKQIGRELGVRYVLEGSVRKSGNRARITAQLIEAATGAHVWAERFDRELADIFAVQDEITGSVVNAIEPAMAQAEQQRVSRKLPDSLDAWEAYHRGLWHFLKQEPGENDQARPFFQRAIDLDREFAPGYYGLAMTHLWDAVGYNMRPLQESLSAARPLAQRAVNLDDADSMAHFALGNVFFLSGDTAGARHEMDRAISINPNNAWAVAVSGCLFGNSGRLSEALGAIGKAMRASPHDPLTWIWMIYVTIANYFARDYQAALDSAERLIRFRPDKPQAYRWRAAALGQLGRLDEAKIALEQAIAVPSANFNFHVRTHPPWIRSEDHALMLEGLRKAGLPDEPSLALPDKPSIAVLPFQNMSGDPEQEYFADGMVEEIITALSRFKNLFVIARNSSFTYKGRAVDVKQVGRELGVRYVLEGSVRKAANRVRITAQLIDAASGAHLRAERFDSSVENIFDLQDQVAESVIGSIAPKLEEAEIERAKSKPTESLDAYDYYLRGLSTIRLFSSEAIRDSLRQYQRAIELDPEFAAAYGMMAWCYFRRYSNALMADWAGESVEAIAMARRAVELGGDDAIALCMGGVTLAGIGLELDAGDAYIDRALALNPNLAIAWSNSSLVKIFLGEHALAIDRITHAMRLNPLDPLLYRVHGLLAYAHFFSGHDDEALSWADKAFLAQPSFVPSAGIAAACYTKASRIADARRIVARMLQASPEMRISNFPILHALRRQEDVVRYRDELRKAGLPD